MGSIAKICLGAAVVGGFIAAIPVAIVLHPVCGPAAHHGIMHTLKELEHMYNEEKWD